MLFKLYIRFSKNDNYNLVGSYKNKYSCFDILEMYYNNDKNIYDYKIKEVK